MNANQSDDTLTTNPDPSQYSIAPSATAELDLADRSCSDARKLRRRGFARGNTKLCRSAHLSANGRLGQSGSITCDPAQGSEQDAERQELVAPRINCQDKVGIEPVIFGERSGKPDGRRTLNGVFRRSQPDCDTALFRLAMLSQVRNGARYSVARVSSAEVRLTRLNSGVRTSVRMRLRTTAYSAE